MRLQKFLTEVGYCSRKQAEGLIRAGKITLNGKKAILGDKVTGDEDIVIDGQKLEKKKPSPKKVILFNKPKDVDCSLIKNPWVKTLMDFDFGPDRVFPIGKLDKEAHGLLLLTNDGALGNKLASPDSMHSPEYIVVVNEPIPEDVIAVFSGEVKKENVKFRMDSLKQLSETSWEFKLLEGRIKHIKKVCDPAGVEFTDLKRTRFGSIGLGELGVGEWRELNADEIMYLNGEEPAPVKKTGRRILFRTPKVTKGAKK